MTKVNNNKPSKEDVLLFLVQSNMIEGVYGNEAVQDSLKAWEYAMRKDVITIDEVLHIHKLVMKRLNPRIAGRLRECDVWVGGDHKKFLGTKILRGRVRSVLEKMKASIDGNVEPNKKVDYPKRCHVTFEDIHPFEDGNGRVGRIIYNWHRLKMGLDLHIIHAGAEQKEYYTWFKDKNLWV